MQHYPVNDVEVVSGFIDRRGLLHDRNGDRCLLKVAYGSNTIERYSVERLLMFLIGLHLHEREGYGAIYFNDMILSL